MIKELKALNTIASAVSLAPVLGGAIPVLNTFATGGGGKLLSDAAKLAGPGLEQATTRVEGLLSNLRGGIFSADAGGDRVSAFSQKTNQLFPGGLSLPKLQISSPEISGKLSGLKLF